MVKSSKILFLILTLLFVISLCTNLCFAGDSTISFSDFSAANFIFYEIRLPKAITAICAGSALAAAGLILQIIFRNPLAGPYALGISSGASLGVAIVVLANTSFGFLGNYFFGKSLILLSSISGSFLVTFIILALNKKTNNNIVLLLVGLMISQICSALQSILEYFANPNSLKNFITYSMGALTNASANESFVLFGIIILSLTLLLLFSKPLNAFLLGEKYTNNLGFNYNHKRFMFLVFTSVLTGLITAYCGPIAFIGIAIPILSRWLQSSSNQTNQLLICVMLGASVLLLADIVCYSINPSSVLPINLITTLFGAPIVLTLLLKNKQW